MVPINSRIIVILNTLQANLLRFSYERTLIDSLKSTRSRSEIFLPRKKKNVVESVMYPKPPICSKVRITHLPNRVKSRAVFFTINPVTHKPDEAVNRASMSEIPFVVEIGKYRSIVPIAIIPK